MPLSPRQHGGPSVTAVPTPDTRLAPTSLWTRYRTAGDPEARAQLLARHLGLVHHVAREVSRRIPSVELGELVSAGALGLMKALDSFDLSRGLAFSTYAVLRIRGAILDDLRSRDSTPRSVGVKRRKIEAVAAALEARAGRARHPGGDGRAAWESILPRSGSGEMPWGSTLSRRLPLIPTGRRVSRDAENHADPSVTLPHAAAGGVRARRAAAQLISRLPEQQRRVLALYYYEELNLRQVGEVLHVSESRVSQIRSQALRRLRGPELDSASRGRQVSGEARTKRQGAEARQLRPLFVPDSLLAPRLPAYSSSTPGFGSIRCLALPTSCCTFPLISCALPFSCSPVSPVAPPTALRTLPSTCFAAPLSRSVDPLGGHVLLVGHVITPETGFNVSA